MKPGTDTIHGRRAVLEALRAGTEIQKVVIARGVAGAIVTEIEQEAARAGVEVRIAARKALDQLAGTEHHQGLVAVVGAFGYTAIDAVIGASDRPLVLLDGVTDPVNLGSILRSAEAFGFAGVLIPKHRSVGVTPVVRKVASGAAERIAVVLVSSPSETIRKLKDSELWVLGLDPGAPDYRKFDLDDRRICLVVGAEGPGLSRLVKERCDELVGIPMSGAVASLNAAVAAAVVMSRLTR